MSPSPSTSGMEAGRSKPSRETKRDCLLEAALVHVPFDGWSSRALLQGAADINMEPVAARQLFPKAGDDLLTHFDVWADRRLVEHVDQSEIDALSMRERIARLVWLRLEILRPHREAIRRAVAAKLLPSNLAGAGTALWRSMDLIWAIAGERGAGLSYYTRRSLLLAVWTATFFFWLDDHSVNLRDSLAFLNRRIDDVMQVGRFRAQIEDTVKGLKRLNPLRPR